MTDDTFFIYCQGIPYPFPTNEPPDDYYPDEDDYPTPNDDDNYDEF